MKISGLQKTTLLDFPNKVACIVFLQGCNFRCPFCHNSDLVIHQNIESISEDEFFDFLDKRSNLLDGVCVTGGEPTLYNEQLIQFIKKVKEKKLCVKLDTNGTNPKLLEELIKKKLIDYVAMDIKNCKEKYALTSGCNNLDLNLIEDSILLLKQNLINYEFRTTVVNPIHQEEDFIKIGNWIGDCNTFYLQNFVNSGSLINEDGLSSYSIDKLNEFRKILENEMNSVIIRY